MDQHTARGFRLAVGIGIGVGLIAAALLVSVWPAEGRDRTLVTVMVRLDTQFTDIAQMLKDAGAIASTDQLVERARTRGLLDQVKVGPHTLVIGDSLDQILDKLVQMPK